MNYQKGTNNIPQQNKNMENNTCKHNFKLTPGVPSDGCVECVVENGNAVEKIQKDYFKWKKKNNIPDIQVRM